MAVIVLPMVMDREPRPASQDIQVRIPSQDATGLASKVLPGKPAASPMPAPEPRPAADPAPKADAAGPAPVAAATAAKPAPAAPPEKASERPPAPAKASAPKPAADGSGQWIVQLGAYKEAGNVKLLLGKLKGIGVPAYSEQFESAQGQRTRVRAGPFPSQEAAEKARTRIKIIGVDGPVAQK
ncbi:SPOR domain-containing protein [Sulfuritalea sp.]|uniref:SPOR domain-containing protein n=1 Tax=Sulfuritalea sp. TaxID=2480090 RepID=UPI001AC79431|nr:SPOR domain-containing protein [Sulfuritalea sp.]MBN8476165.1 SPOR domain-containing protein [Sulfuritalea sp.]